MKTIIISLVVLCIFYLVISYLKGLYVKKRKKNIIGAGGQIRVKRHLKADIVGKSKFQLSHSQPEAATSPEDENPTKKASIFAPSNEIKPSAQLPPEELDEAFSDTPSDENNEPMDIYYPLEYETDEEVNNEPDEEEETEEVEGMAQAAYASGVPFEDLGNAVITVSQIEKATQAEKTMAGATLLEMRQTDLFEQLVSGSPDRRETVSILMDERLAAFYRTKDAEAGANTPDSRKAPDSFDIRDYV